MTIKTVLHVRTLEHLSATRRDRSIVRTLQYSVQQASSASLNYFKTIDNNYNSM